MALIEHIFKSLFAAGQLARGDATAIELFEATFTGFLKSLLAGLICAPLYALLIWLVGPLAAPEVYATFFLASWAITPAVMYPILKIIKLDGRFWHLMVAGNWAQVPVLGLFILSSLVLTTLPDLAALQAGVGLLIFTVTIYYIWFVVRTALGSTGGIAASIVLLDTLLNMVLRYTVLGA